MKNTKTSNGGYMMILMLLISVVIMVFLIMKSMTLLQKSNPNTSGTNLNNANISEQGINGGLAPINAAKNAKNLIEKDNAKAIEQLK